MLYRIALSALMLISSSHAQRSITAQCSGTLDPSIDTKDLIAIPEAHGPDFMRGIFCSFYKETPSGSPYSLCSDSESSDCTRTENRNSWSVTGTRHMTPFQQSVCSAGFSDIIFTCIKKGFSKGTFGDDDTPYQLSMEVKPNPNPTLAPACEGDLKISIEKDALWEMRGWMCAAGGCEGSLDNCELFSAADNYRLHLTGNPLDQTTTQFSQICYDATEIIIRECWYKGKAGGTIDARGGQSYGFVLGEGSLPAFQGQDLEDPNGNDGF